MKKFFLFALRMLEGVRWLKHFLKKYLPAGFRLVSAGTKPAVKVNPIVVQAMKEIGVDIDNTSPKNISQQMIDDAQIAINMVCMDKESCPALFLKYVIDWQMQDPKGISIEEVREIRDKIEQKVKDFIDFVTERASVDR